MWEIRQEGGLSWTGDVVICSAGMSALVKTRTCSRRARSCERFEYIAAAVRCGSPRGEGASRQLSDWTAGMCCHQHLAGIPVIPSVR